MFTILENFRETILFIVLGNIASSLKFEFICRKIGLVLFAMELDTHELFRCLTRDCNYRDEIQKQIALHEFQSSEALGDFWSFLKLYMYIQIDFMYAIRSHKKRRAKYQTEMLSQIPKEQFRYKQCFQQKKPWLETPMTRNSTAIMPMDIHKQAIGKKNCRQVEFERQAVRTKATRSTLRLCLHTVDRTFIYTNFLSLWIWQI